MYWLGQKVHSGFSISAHKKTQTNFLANPILEHVHKGSRGSFRCEYATQEEDNIFN